MRWAAILAGLGLAAASAGGADRPGEADARKLVAMVGGSSAQGSVQGAAVILGLARDRLYLVTANHLIESERKIAGDLQVEIKALPGEHLPTEVLDRDRDRDLAVLVVKGVADRGLSAADFPFHLLGDPRTLKRGSEVFSIGQARGVRWWANVSADVVSEVSSSHVYFQSPLVRPGQSGGGLFDADWRLVGLVSSESTGTMEAVRIDEVIDFVRRHDYPVSLSAEAGSRSAAVECGTKRLDFNAPEPWRPNGTGGHFGVESSAFEITVGYRNSGDKRCVDCAVKAAVFRVSATVWGDDRAASWGVYLETSGAREHWFSFEIEREGRAAIKRYRGGPPAVLWSGNYQRRDKDRVTLEASDGSLVASVNGAEVGRAKYDASTMADRPVGVGFVITTGAQVPAAAWFDDYELTTCDPGVSR